MTGRTLLRLAVAIAVLGAVAACAPRYRIPAHLAQAESAAEESAPQGGPALQQYRARLARMHRDLVHLQASLESLRSRRDRRGFDQLSQFVDAYMGIYLEPVLRPEWQSRHPELMALDANLRLMQADILLRLRDNGRAKRAMDEIEKRYEGRGDMLVDYPAGHQSSLGEAFEILREGRWRNAVG